MSDEWSIDDDAAAAIAGQGFDHPMSAARAFMAGVSDLDNYRHLLPAVVTPESMVAWGDFTEVAARLDEIGDWGLGSLANPAPGARDVAYAKVVAGVRDTYRVETPEVATEVITLVWRPEVGHWLVHGFGAALLPEEVPRSSPNVAPEY